jgi:gamma-glutamyltranspeptidase / glutathione hydrolase
MSKRFGSGAVSCPEPHAANAAGRILEAGGNAVDAAVAGAFAQGVVNPALCGIGGTGYMMVHNPGLPAPVKVSARGGAGAQARPDVYRTLRQGEWANRFLVEGYENYIGYKSITIPTIVRVLGESHARYGRLPWRDLLRPAIELAADGFQVYPFLFHFWDPDDKLPPGAAQPPRMVQMTATDECARIYTTGGRTYRVGEVLKQEDYARTLERLADRGADEFYTGEVGRQIAADFERNDALVTRGDLERCVAEFPPVVSGTFHGYTFFTDGPPGMGPLEIQALHILDQIDLDSLGRYSARYYNVLARVFQTIYAHRQRYNADPAFHDVPVDLFLSRDRARDLARAILDGAGIPVARAGVAQTYTTHISVVDSEGGAAGMMHSNGSSAGVVTPGLGFLYNHHMHNFDARPGQLDSIQPGKRGRSGCSPVMLFRDGQIQLVSGSLTRYKVTNELQALLSIVDFGEDVQTAVCRPRIHAEYDPETIYVEPELPTALVDALQGMGWKTETHVMTTPLCIVSLLDGGPPRVAVDPRGGGGHWPPQPTPGC